jgi:hypothetical protein
VSFSALDDDDGLLVADPIERRQFRLYTPDGVTPRPADPDRFRFPVDAAVAVETGEFALPSVVATYVRDADGGMLAEAEHFADESFTDGSYELELCAPVKLYVRVEGDVSVVADAARTRIRFDDARTVYVGARSHHDNPAATVTTTGEPRDVMRAVSTFGSALKTTSPERSYPTLRGHPPLLELGEELSIPPGLEPPSDVTVEVPPDLASVYVVSPLSYYLGARVVPGSVPRVVAGGFEHRLDSARGVEREVERVLKQTFLLDCVTRTEGYYRVDLHEREALTERVDLDLPALYEASSAERLRAYLSVPYDDLRDLVPEWKLTTHVAPTADNVELLPFASDDLAVVKTPDATPVATSDVQSAAAGAFFRDDSFTRGGATDADRSYVQPEATDSLEQAWVGEGTPVGASKATTAAYRNRVARSPSDGDIGITVVCNDPRMAVERDVVDAVYGSRQEVPFEVDRHYALDRAELREVLTAETDYLHYIGHIDEAGFECADGKLDATTLESVGTDAFLLNACQSYDQGGALVDGGAIGGIVTLSDVVNAGAVEMGRTLARLLNRGFPLQSALEIARGESAVGSQYTVVGDGGLSIAQAESGTPLLYELGAGEDAEFELAVRAFPTSDRGMGSLVIPYLESNETHFLTSGELDTFELDADELRSFFALEDAPVRVAGELQWSMSLDLSDLGVDW